jgi:hypothetical protein
LLLGGALLALPAKTEIPVQMYKFNDQADEKDDLVITPAGPVRRDKVNPVGPGEAVRRNEDGSYTVVRQAPPLDGEKEDCMAEEYVITPGGYRPKSQVHPVESGHILDGTGGNIRLLDQARQLVTDYGPVPVKPGTRPLMPQNVTAVNPALLQAELPEPSGSAAAP